MNIHTYTEWYNSPASDPRNGNYTSLFALFDANVVQQQPVDMLNQVTQRSDSKLAFVTLGSDGLVRVLHRLRRYEEELGEPPRLFGGKNFAIRGEITDWGATLVEVPTSPFTRTNALNSVLTTATANEMAALFPQHGQIAVLANPPENHIGPARSRLLMVIPPRLVGTVLTAAASPEGLTPLDLWQNVSVPLWEDEVTRVSCAPFIDWCRIAYSHGVGEANPLHIPAPVAIEPNARLQKERIDMVRQDLPLRFQFGVQLADPALGQVVQALEGFQNTYLGQAQAAEARELARQAASKLPSKRWPETYARLLRLCNVATEQELPDVWRAMASQGAKQDRQTIQHHLSANCEAQIGQSGSDDRAPEVTADLATQLGQLRFISGPNHLAVGMSIFMVSFPNGDLAAKISTSSGLYDQKMQGTTSRTLDEVMDVKKAQKFQLPTNFIEVKNVCWCYHRFLAVMLGFGHDIPKAFGKLVRSLEGHEQLLHQEFDRNLQYCAGLLRFIQIDMHDWLSDTLAGREAKVPEFDAVVANIKRQCWMVPRMPEEFLDVATTVAEAPIVVASRAATPSQSTPAANTNKIKAPLSALSPEIVPIQPNFPAYAFTETHGPPPRNERNQVMCLSFHVKADCWKNCRRKADHKKHSESDSKKLAKYLASKAA
jgi:hypothetical protein